MRIIRRARQVWRHQDTVEIVVDPPVVDADNTAFKDVSGWKRLVAQCILRTNTETDARNVKATWIIDGNTYESEVTSLNHNTLYYVHRIPQNYTKNLIFSTTPYNMLIFTNVMCENAELLFTSKTSIGTNPIHKYFTIYEELQFV